jgi:hypothetical protein
MAKKVLVKKEWRLLKADGSGLERAAPCGPPVPGVDEVWIPDGIYDFRRAPDATGEAPPPPDPMPVGSREYMALSQRDEWFMGRFSPERLTERLNALSRDGWRVIAATTSDVGTWFGSFAGGMRQEMVVILERVVGEGVRVSALDARPVPLDESVP